ncbi:RidA family protein [Nonomuraea soli]|uniref:Enamine deaminase RidA (YjgF/YER057c/UK114 family) n=1 Tax=Nonomuraea soli TaxID=1032476 RepID=A0A7W0HPD3_9ACTN|nr:RidA family protein [Nonomuraea soli]MBA2890739.1 enamine deaminase RidA (YjgF/YER057c/UK114 family) [Nonomuraea soli]
MTVRLPAVTGATAQEAYARALGDLERAGLSADDIVQVVQYVTDPADACAPDGVTVSTVSVEALLDGAAAIELTAHPGGGERIPTPDGVVTVADEIVYLPGILPADLTAGFREQYRSCLEVAGELLKAAGTGLDALVQTTDYTATATRAEYPRCGRPRRELLGGTGTDGLAVHPGAAGILVDRPPVPGAMVWLDAVASRSPLRTVNPGWRRYETLTYKPGVAAGDTLFMSGFGALEPATQRAIFDGDLEAQAEFTYAAIATVLREAGLTGESVVRLVEYVTPDGVAKYPEIAAIRERYFPGRPALTSVVCSALLRPEFLIEVVPTAVFR